MKPYPYMPGVPAAGHISRGFWHPGPVNGCQKCPDTTPPRDRHHRPATAEEATDKETR